MSGWERYNHNTHCVETPDGTVVAKEIIDGICCLADLFYVMRIRAEQRRQLKQPTGHGVGDA